MLTIRFDALGLQPGDAVLDVGSGFGRHVYECARRGARVVALDHADDEVIQTRNTLAAMVDAGEITTERVTGVLRGDASALPAPVFLAALVAWVFVPLVLAILAFQRRSI